MWFDCACGIAGVEGHILTNQPTKQDDGEGRMGMTVHVNMKMNAVAKVLDMYVYI